MWTFYVSAVVVCFLIPSFTSISLDGSRYKGIVISFSSSAEEGDVNLKRLQLLLSSSSKYLFHASRRRAYFSEFTFVLPSHWSSGFCEKHALIREIPHEPPAVYVHDIKHAQVQHSRGCGEMGELIHLPLSWLNEDSTSIAMRSRQFVQLWANYRYGVFEETPLRPEECYSSDGSMWSPAGCYNTNFTTEWELDENGLPRCSFGSELLHFDMKSSIMFDVRPENMTEFCDGSSSFPHSPVAPTRHNILCKGSPVWKIIEKNEDFRYGRNPPQNPDFVVPDVLFKCYHEKMPSLFLAVQNASLTDMTNVVNEIRYVLLRFMLYGMPATSQAAVLAFSDDSHTEGSKLHVLDLADSDAVAQTLRESVRVMDHVDSVCVICGLKKVVKAANITKDPSTIIVFITLVSDVKGASSVQIAKELESVTQKFVLILIQDTEGESVQTEIFDAVHKIDGEIYSVPSSPVFLNSKLNVILSHVYRSPFYTEDRTVIAHQGMYHSIGSDFTDSFVVDPLLKGQLLYTLKCSDSDRLGSTACSSPVKHLSSGSYQCSMTLELNASSNSTNSQQISFKYYRGTKNLTCASLASVQVKDNMKQVTLRGWLSHYVVTPTSPLTVYAEVLKNLTPLSEVHIKAQIFQVTSLTSWPIYLELRDNGNGDPDTLRGDGIYSRYFPFKVKKGIYSVLIRIIASYNSRGDENGIVSEWTQIKALGSFIVTEDIPELYIYPPNRVADLTVASVNHENNTVMLQWTAPGGDLDRGRANQYIVKYSSTWQNLMDDTFMTATVLKSPDVTKPSFSGVIEKQMFVLPETEGRKVYFVAMKAVDDHQRYSSVSNIVQVFMAGHNQNMTTVTETLSSSSDFTSSSTDFFTVLDNSTNNSIIIDDSTTHTTLQSLEMTTATADPSAECVDKNHVIMMASSIGCGCLLLIIVINVVICIVCKRKRGSMSKHKSMLPPHNMNIAYKDAISNQVSNLSGTSMFLEGLQGQSARQEPQYEQAFPLRDNVKDAVIRANRLHWQNNASYGEYRDNLSSAAHYGPVSGIHGMNPKPEYADNRDYSANTTGSSVHLETDGEKISVDELGFV